MKTDPNEPIAPTLQMDTKSGVSLPRIGLTKREHFAALALQGILSNGQSHSLAAIQAVNIADLIISILNEEVEVKVSFEMCPVIA